MRYPLDNKYKIIRYLEPQLEIIQVSTYIILKSNKNIILIAYLEINMPVNM